MGCILKSQHVKLIFFLRAELLGSVRSLSCIKHSIKLSVPKCIYCVLKE